ncbi:transcriptional regulator FtrA [Acetobacter tropicalis]|nr:transcriptional regulator FtrA [Acetobacter tropicalis]
MPNGSSPLIVIMAYDQLCTFEFGCAFEVFGLSRPEMGSGWYRCLTVAAEPEPIRAAGGLRLEAAGGLELLDRADTIIIPGWRGPDAVAPPLLLDALRRAHAAGTRIVSICGATFVLAQAGLLAGKRATTHWRHASILASRYPDIVVEGDALYVDEGDILTSAGSAAGLDLCLHIVRKDFGAKAANSVARRLVVAAHRDGGQSQFIERSVPPPSGARLSELLETVQKRIGEKWSLERMAEIAHVSIRTLHRHIYESTGLAPSEWVKRQRIAYARDLLEETTLSVDEIAQRSGFGTTTNFRQHFRGAIGLPPASYRCRFLTRPPTTVNSLSRKPDIRIELNSKTSRQD